MPKVSVIIATYSRPQLLPRAVESAFEGGTDVEVIVVDDASKDETANVCRKLEGIKYVRVERNQHTAGARNLGISASTAPFISFLDDDDWRLPNSYDEQIELLEENEDCGLVYGQYLLADQKGKVMPDLPLPQKCPEGDVFWQIMKVSPIGCLTAVFRKECIYKVGMLDVNYPGVDDWDMWVRIAELYKFSALKKPVAVWRQPHQHSGQGSSNITNLYKMGAKLLVNKWLHLPRVKRELSAKEIEKKKKEILWMLSDQILNDMAQTEGVLTKIQKAREAVRVNPDLLGSSYLYKVLAKNLT